VKSISKREGLCQDGVESVAASRDGNIWIGTSCLQVLGPHGMSSGPGKALPGNQVTSIFEDDAGRLWAGMMNRLFVYERGRSREITKMNGSAVGMVMGITEDSENTIWIESAGPPGTLFRIQDLKVRQEFPASPDMPLARKIVADPQSGIWLGLVTGDLARYRDGQINAFAFGDHPNSRVIAIARASDGSILGATGFGVVGWKNGKQQILTVHNGLPCNAATALISDDAGNLWLLAECGLIEIPNDQMKLWWEHPENKLKVRVFDTLDGVQPGLGHFNTSAKTPDGRLWFANGNVVQVIDPAHIVGNTLPPPVHISALVADRKAYVLESGIRLPPLTRDLEIDYTALSYVAPQKVLFRYMLEGYDPDWQEPGTRRQAFYNDLRPGRYRFRVIACNNDGVWNEAGASLAFSILPAYYQTAWFRASCAAGFLLLLWGIYRFRVQQLHRQFAIGLEARVNERTRIARELHDTLLQTLHGLMFHFQAVRNLLPRRPEKAMQSLDDAINETEKALAESRDAIQGLRSEPIARESLAELLTAASKESADPGTANHELPVFDLIEEGERRTLSPTANNEICRIVREILRNAYRHAQATRIETEIRYDDQLLRVRIRDNGRGIDPKVLKEGGIAGHWGLRGARERAERMGAQLDFWSETGAGTEVQLTVPGSVAYETSRDGFGSKLLRKIGNRAQRS
jgi:signal transduction histidine kinase